MTLASRAIFWWPLQKDTDVCCHHISSTHLSNGGKWLSTYTQVLEFWAPLLKYFHFLLPTYKYSPALQKEILHLLHGITFTWKINDSWTTWSFTRKPQPVLTLKTHQMKQPGSVWHHGYPSHFLKLPSSAVVLRVRKALVYGWPDGSSSGLSGEQVLHHVVTKSEECFVFKCCYFCKLTYVDDVNYRWCTYVAYVT